MNILNKSKHAIKIGKLIADAETVVSWEYEEESVEGSFDFGDEKANAEYLARFESGELLCVRILVTCRWNSFEGTDSLGMCHVKASDLDRDIEDLVRDHGMQKNPTIQNF